MLLIIQSNGNFKHERFVWLVAGAVFRRALLGGCCSSSAWVTVLVFNEGNGFLDLHTLTSSSFEQTVTEGREDTAAVGDSRFTDLSISSL